MADKWVVDEDNPQGHLVAMTAEEEAQLAADRAAAASWATTLAASAGNRATITAAVSARMAQIRTARAAIAGGQIFAGLSANEKNVIDGLLQDDLYFARLALNQYDATNGG